MTGFLNASSRAVMAWPRRTKSRMAAFGTASNAAKFMDIGAGGKSAFTRAGQDHCTHAVVGLDRIQRRHQAVDQRKIQRIELVGAVERNKRDPVIDFKQEESDIAKSPGAVGVLPAP